MYSVVLESVGVKKDEVKKYLMEKLNCTEQVAFKYVNVNPSEIMTFENYEAAKSVEAELIELGAYIKIINGSEIMDNSGSASNKCEVSMNNSNDTTYKTVGVIFFIGSCIFTAIGFYKMFVYENNDYGYNLKNAYVGGDAYNYIINGTHSIAFFILGMGFIDCWAYMYAYTN